MVRAVFHDCVGQSRVIVAVLTLSTRESYILAPSGGCDGCLNRNVPDNQGLPDLTNFMTTVDMVDQIFNWVLLYSGLSRADVYVLAAMAGIENAVSHANGIEVPYDLDFTEPCLNSSTEVCFGKARECMITSCDHRLMTSDFHSYAFSHSSTSFMADETARSTGERRTCGISRGLMTTRLPPSTFTRGLSA